MDAKLEHDMLDKVRQGAGAEITIDADAVMLTVNDDGSLVTEASDIGIRDRWPTTITVKTPGGNLKFIRGEQIRHGDEECGGYAYELLDGTTRVSKQRLVVLND